MALIVAAAILATLLLVLAGLAVASMTLTTADVVIELRQQPVTGSVTVRVVATGSADPDDALVIPGRYVTVDVTIEQTTVATGTANVGITPASGTVQLANPDERPVEIPAGTTATGDTGIEFRFTTDVTVPAATDSAPGQGEAAIETISLGSAANLGAGDLNGLLDSGVYFSNRLLALAGGTDQAGTVVTEADLATLRDAAAAAVSTAANERFGQTLLADVTVIPSTFQVGEPRETFDHAAGDAGERVTLKAVYAVSALTYSESDLEELAGEQIAQSLARGVPAGFELDVRSIRLGAPEVVSDGGQSREGTTVDIPVTARAVAVLTPAREAELAAELSGQDDDTAVAMLSGDPAVARVSIRHSPGWLARGMPDDADRIEIQIED